MADIVASFKALSLDEMIGAYPQINNMRDTHSARFGSTT